MSAEVEKEVAIEGDGHQKRRRLIEVDRVTGFAIFLVVVGHIVAREPPADNDWYVHLKFIIYQFHMPMFMFMSGLVFQYTYPAISTLSQYRRWATTKAKRLAPGFLLVGVTITLGKALSENFIHVDNTQGDLLGSFINLFVRPTESAAGSLWYIYVLLEFYLFFPIMIILSGNKKWIVLVLVLSMHLTHQLVRLPKVFALHTIFEFGLYFWLGALSCLCLDWLLAFVKRRGWIFALLFAASLISMEFLPWRQSQTLIGLASIPAVTFLIGSNTGKAGMFFAALSGYTFVIYLLNTLVIGITKGVLLELLPWDGVNFYFFFIALCTAGLVVPIALHRWVFSRNKTIARIMN